MTLVTLMLFYGAFALVDGVSRWRMPSWAASRLALVARARRRARHRGRLLTFPGPGLVALVLLIFIAGWAIALGILQIIGAIRLRKEIDNEWRSARAALSVMFGVVMLTNLASARWR